MKILICVFFLTAALFISCVSQNPNSTKSSQILKEIDEISVKYKENGNFEKVMSVSKRLSENRKSFPEKREQLREDAMFLKNYSEKEVERNNLIIQKLNELLNLNPISSEAECIKHQVISLEKNSENIKLGISDFDLFLDESIKDKETLNIKSQPIKNELEKISQEINSLDEQSKLKCNRKLK